MYFDSMFHRKLANALSADRSSSSYVFDRPLIVFSQWHRSSDRSTRDRDRARDRERDRERVRSRERIREREERVSSGEESSDDDALSDGATMPPPAFQITPPTGQTPRTVFHRLAR